MKYLVIFFLLLSFIINGNAQRKQVQPAIPPRIEKVINSHWTFNYLPDEKADKGYESSLFDDSKWPAISIPHTWNTYETTGEVHPFIRDAYESDNPYWWNGWGWYRKHFTINPVASEKKVFIEFEGVQKYCKVWINGKYLGDHKGGYGSFDFDITDHVTPGKDNVLAVAVNNTRREVFGIPPMAAGNFNVSGGIYRDVTLVLKEKLYIPMQGSASHEGGTFISTPQVTDNEGIVRIQTWVQNDFQQQKECILNTCIIDGSGRIVQEIKSKASITPGQMYMFDQLSKPLIKPHLWSPDDPNMYKVRSELTSGKKVTDVFLSPLGFRWFRWDYKENNLYVNGKKVLIHEGNLHQEYPWLGNAIPKWITEMDFRYIDENLNYNFMRTAHYPDDKYVYDLTDKYGIIVSEESPGIRNHEFFADVQEQQMKEMIRRDRNHPSIMFRSRENETDHAVDSTFALAEDTIRQGTIYATGIKDGKSVNAEIVMAGVPARIVLKSSHSEINADRASVVIITAEIVDPEGNHVNGATNSVKWKVTGPASLAGHPVCESDMYKNYQMKGVWYINMPFSNVIRSTGLPGKINVIASSPGLASGSVCINALEITADNSIISETILNNEGRRPVSGQIAGNDPPGEPQGEIKKTYQELNLGIQSGGEYKKMLRDIIFKDNPAVDTATIEFRILVSLFASHLKNNKGILIADDYNFNTGHYNHCRVITGYINPLKLPPLFKDGLRRYYAEEIIIKGNEKNAGDEMNWLNWIPSGGTVIISRAEKVSSWPKGTMITSKSDLDDLITAAHPVFEGYSTEAKERALVFISKMNPYIKLIQTSESKKTGKEEKFTYIAEKSRPILIPLIKFISE